MTAQLSPLRLSLFRRVAINRERFRFSLFQRDVDQNFYSIEFLIEYREGSNNSSLNCNRFHSICTWLIIVCVCFLCTDVVTWNFYYNYILLKLLLKCVL